MLGDVIYIYWYTYIYFLKIRLEELVCKKILVEVYLF